jgi:hypothetical protein
MGRERGRNGEGEVSLQATWDKGGRGSHHTKRRDSKYVRGTQVQGELSRGLRHGLASSTCIYVSCCCVNVANKRIMFRL